MKTWFVTGVTRGLGKAVAESALLRGDMVIGTFRADVPVLDAPANNLHLIRVDLSQKECIPAAVTEAFKLCPEVDIVLNNAGYGLIGPIETATDEEVERLFEVNTFAPFRIIREMLPRLRAQRRGHIVNITSIAARAPGVASGLYASAKAAIEALSHSLSQEVAPFGIKVTAVAPGGFRTDFLSPHSLSRSVVENDYSETVGKALDRYNQLYGKSLGDPKRAAEVILQVADSPSPPVHLLLGFDAVLRTRTIMKEEQLEIDQWESVSRSTDFP